MRMLPKTNEHSFFGCGRMTHTAFWERGRTKRMLMRTRGLYIIAMVLAAPPSAANWAFGPSSASDEEESELWASSSEPSTAQRKKTSGQTRSAIKTTNLYFLCLLCLFANYNAVIWCNLLWLWIWPACCMLMISSYHPAIPQSKEKGRFKNKLQYHFVWHCLSISLRSRLSYDGMGGMLEELSTKAPCNKPKEVDSTCNCAALSSSTCHTLLGSLNLQWKFVHDAGASPCENTCTNQTSTKSSMLSQRLCGNVAPQQAPDLTCQRLEH